MWLAPFFWIVANAPSQTPEPHLACTLSVEKAPCGTRFASYGPFVSIAELRQLPPDEKLKIIEALWSDLAADEASVPSPVWHEAELRRTEADFAAGRIESLDWDEAKKELRKRFE